MTTGNKILELLYSSSEDDILKGIEIMRIEGSCKLIPALISVLHHSENNFIRKSISSVLFDLKDKESVPFLIESIRDEENHDELDILVSACWQTGLDFSDHIILFSELFVKEDYIVSIEAYTVIDTHFIENKLSDKSINQMLEILKPAVSTIALEKKTLLEELIKTLIA
ncbi:hypothetical protein ACFLTI_03375 [Bacteroidota bacterium]